MTSHPELIEAVREVAEAEDWRLAKSTLAEDYERGERKVVLTLLQSSGEQQKLDLDEKDE